MAREEEHPRVHLFPTATLSLMSIANWMSKTRKSEREKKIQLKYQAKLYYDDDRVKTRQWTPRARARRRRRRKVGSRHTTSKDWNFVALFTSGGANHSHRSRVRAERRAVVVEIAPKRYVRALTTLARARESERTFFSPRRVDRAGREWGRSGNHRRAASRPTAVGTPRVARARLTTIVDDARGARAASRRARRRPRSISESASLRLLRRSFSSRDENGILTRSHHEEWGFDDRS